ncbi:rhomboid family intramembrane serine protease [Nocardioides ultimimeridianus]
MNDPAGVPTCYRHPGRETYIRCQRCDRPICPDCMRDAAVGYQCPSCVSEGHKSTRSGRTAYGGLVPDKPGAVTMVLIGINAVVWLVIQATGGYGSKLYEHFALIRNGFCANAGFWAPSEQTCRQSPAGQWIVGVHDAPWQLITSAFTHVDILHIAFNMYALLILGPMLERKLGAARFIAVYLISALSGSVCVLWLDQTSASVVGASGAVFGMMAALIVGGRKSGEDISSLWLLLGINVVLSFQSHVSWQGHLGGFVAGGLAMAVLAYAPRERRTLIQGAGLTSLAALLLVAAVLRMSALS